RARPRPSRRRAMGQRSAEGEIVAQGTDRTTGADEIEVPGGIGVIAAQDGPDKAVLRDDELAIDAEAGVVQHDRLGAGRPDKIARGKDVDTRNLEIGGEDRAGIVRVLAGEPARQHGGLLVAGLDQAVALAAMLDAFA